MPFLLGEIPAVVTTYISKQWDTFISNFALFAALGVVLYFIFQKAVEHRFQSQLTKLKGTVDEEVQGKLISLKGDVDHDVQSKIENLRSTQQNKLESLKLEHQKMLLNFETFNSKQNERYPQLYFLTEQALGYITYLRGIQSFPTFENAAIEDVKTYCEVIEMNTGDCNRILALWEQDKDKAISEIHKLKKIIDYNRAENKWYEANDYLIYNELYFSDEVTDHSRKLLDLMYKYWLNLNPVYHNPIFSADLREMRKDNSVIKQEIDEQRKIWKAIMKKEVSGLPTA
ncbi:hypothetical protein QNH39_06995 [Neobacillus novalis]|uniref:Uncharacterized protein n=2 Tax=Neobacillus novalis TaxID=220687 RepID=A0AA95SCC4_9BACI|nr:hypothetical protein [Neobacillus novalis]WHY87569.1 hypothetical protein QNH39_06995 [Neobacillus novalis]